MREALDLAIRDELLAREAARRGIDAPTRAQQIDALIAREQRTTDGLTAETITDEAARAWYQKHRALFGDVAQAGVAWAKFTNGAQARKLLERVAETDQPTFLRLVAGLLPLIADMIGRAVGITTTVGALVMLAWGLILGLGIGLWFVLPALLLGMAAVASIAPRRATAARNQKSQTMSA